MWHSDTAVRQDDGERYSQRWSLGRFDTQRLPVASRGFGRRRLRTEGLRRGMYFPQFERHTRAAVVRKVARGALQQERTAPQDAGIPGGSVRRGDCRSGFRLTRSI